VITGFKSPPPVITAEVTPRPRTRDPEYFLLKEEWKTKQQESTTNFCILYVGVTNRKAGTAGTLSTPLEDGKNSCAYQPPPPKGRRGEKEFRKTR